MTTNPKLIIRDILVAHKSLLFTVFIDDRRQLLHFVALWIETADLLDIGNHIVEIDFAEINDQFFVRHSLDPLRRL